MNTDLISVIIPSYKPANYIYRCLESVARQDIDKQRYEVIIVLNGCNEPYHTDIKLFLQQKFQGIKTLLLQTDVAGVSNARNIGLDNAQGEYITFIDDDDWVSHNYLKGLLEVANPDYIMISNVIQIEEKTQKQLPYYLHATYLNLKDINHVSKFKVRSFLSTACVKLIPKAIIENRRFNNQLSIGEDAFFMFLISDKINGFSFAKSDVIYYRVKRDNSATYTKRNFKQRLEIARKLISAYHHVYLPHISKYNPLLFISRIVATVMNLIGII